MLVVDTDGDIILEEEEEEWEVSSEHRNQTVEGNETIIQNECDESRGMFIVISNVINDVENNVKNNVINNVTGNKKE